MFTPADAGALMRYADDLADIRRIPLKAVTILQRLVFRYRPKGGCVACVGLDELAGDGLARGTLIRILDALERARLIVKEKWGIVVGGRWRQMPNRYHLRTAAEAMAAAIASADAELEPEHVLGTVSLPSSESNFCTVSKVIEENSSSVDKGLPGAAEGQQEADKVGGSPASATLPEPPESALGAADSPAGTDARISDRAASHRPPAGIVRGVVDLLAARRDAVARRFAIAGHHCADVIDRMPAQRIRIRAAT